MYFRYDDKYTLVLTLHDIKTGQKRETSFKRSVADFIDVNGGIVHEIVESKVTKLHNSLLSEKKEK